jgi:hypothetical protein
MFVCDICGKESKSHGEIELCEMHHTGLDSFELYQEYMKLKENARYYTWCVGQTANDETRAAEERAYNNLLEFEKAHHIKVK